MWLLFKETAKGIFYILFCVALFFFCIKELTKNDQTLGMILVCILGIPLFIFSAFLYAYYTILLSSKLKEGYSSLDEIMSENYIFKKEYFIEIILIFEKRIYLNKIEKIILGYYDDDAGDSFLSLLVEYEKKKIYIIPGYIDNFLKYFAENLIGFDSSILKDDSIDYSKIEKHPITLYEKNKIF